MRTCPKKSSLFLKKVAHTGAGEAWCPKTGYCLEFIEHSHFTNFRIHSDKDNLISCNITQLYSRFTCLKTLQRSLCFHRPNSLTSNFHPINKLFCSSSAHPPWSPCKNLIEYYCTFVLDLTTSPRRIMVVSTCIEF